MLNILCLHAYATDVYREETKVSVFATGEQTDEPLELSSFKYSSRYRTLYHAVSASAETPPNRLTTPAWTRFLNTTTVSLVCRSPSSKGDVRHSIQDEAWLKSIRQGRNPHYGVRATFGYPVKGSSRMSRHSLAAALETKRQAPEHHTAPGAVPESIHSGSQR